MPEVMDYSPLVKEVFDNCLGVQAKDRVWIKSWDHTLDIAKAFASMCSLRACPHLLSIRYEDLWLRWILKSPKEQLEVVASQEMAVLEKTDFYIFTMGPRNPVPWGSIPKNKWEAVSVWLDTRYDKTSYARKWARVAKTYKVKMLAVEATLATPERAKAQGLNYEGWREVMFRGCTADHKEFARRSKLLATLMSGKGNVNITTDSGTNLRLALDHRPVDISDGIATEEKAEKGRITFLPAGAIEVSVDEGSVDGRIIYDAPVRLGDEIIAHLAVNLSEGLVKRYNATRGAKAFGQYLGSGGRDAGRFAFLGFGLNPYLRYGYLQDDKVLGGVTLGFGSNSSIGGRNVATEQWWASITNATVNLDGMMVMDKGKLLV